MLPLTANILKSGAYQHMILNISVGTPPVTIGCVADWGSGGELRVGVFSHEALLGGAPPPAAPP